MFIMVMDLLQDEDPTSDSFIFLSNLHSSLSTSYWFYIILGGG